jgi:DNA-binding NarL/FixJ family response regulator
MGGGGGYKIIVYSKFMYTRRQGGNMPSKRKRQESKKLQENTNEPLSDRECEILIHLSRGDSNKTIAISLDMSINTVEKYLSNIYEKLGITSRTEAILWWLEKVRVSVLEGKSQG